MDERLRGVALRWLAFALSPAAVVLALLCSFWLAGWLVPNVPAMRALLGIAAIAAGLVQAQLLVDAIAATRVRWLGDRLAFLAEYAPPPGTVPAAARFFFAAVWFVSAQGAVGPFLARTTGGDLQRRLLYNLGLVRGALAHHRRRHPRFYPVRLDVLMTIPPAWGSSSNYARRLVPHAVSTEVEYYGSEVCRGATDSNLVESNLRDTGHWGYVRETRSACFGRVFIDCTHKDFAGRRWADY